MDNIPNIKFDTYIKYKHQRTPPTNSMLVCHSDNEMLVYNSAPT